MLRRDRSPSWTVSPVDTCRCASAEQARADADRASRPPRPRPASPARCPSTARASPCSAASSASRRNHGRDASGSSASGGIVISPRIDGYRSSQLGDLVRGDARLGVLAREVHLEQRGHREPARRGVGVERSGRARRSPLTTLTLFDCRWPMKCQRNGVAVGGVLRGEVLRAVLADDLHAGLGEDAQLVERDVLRRRDDGHVRPGLVADAQVPLADGRRRSREGHRARARGAGLAVVRRRDRR